MFFLCLISSYLEKPEWYTAYEGKTFEDFCIGQFATMLAELFGACVSINKTATVDIYTVNDFTLISNFLPWLGS